MRTLAAHRIILVVYLVTVAAVCLYAPWMFTGEFHQKISLGYSVLWVPYDLGDSSVDLERVFLELLAVSALAGAAVVLFSTEKNEEVDGR